MTRVTQRRIRTRRLAAGIVLLASTAAVGALLASPAAAEAGGRPALTRPVFMRSEGRVVLPSPSRTVTAVPTGHPALVTGRAMPAQMPSASTVRSAQLTFRNVSNPQDPTFTQLLGINNRNMIAGYFGSGAAGHPNQGFTLALPANFTSENVPGAAQTQVIAVNQSGGTGGFFIDSAGTTHGFVKIGGTFTTIDLPGTPFNQVLGVNDRGQTAGYFQDASGVNHAWIRDASGTFTVPPIANSQATGVNDDGTVVGFTQASATESSGFVLARGHVTLLNVPGSTFTQALGENNIGQIVGFYNDAAGNSHGFVYQHGAFRTVDVPGAKATTVNGINDHGAMVGFFTDAAGNTVGFVATPR